MAALSPLLFAEQTGGSTPPPPTLTPTNTATPTNTPTATPTNADQHADEYSHADQHRHANQHADEYSLRRPIRHTSTPTNTPTPTQPPSGDGSPFGGTPRAVPGTIQAEDYNTGGQGVAFNDTDTTNNGGQYRPSEAVDIQATTDTGGGFNVGWTRAGEWLKYTVNVASSGSYTFNARVASAAAGASFHAEIDGVNVTGALSVPNTGGNQTWTTISKSGINLTRRPARAARGVRHRRDRRHRGRQLQLLQLQPRPIPVTTIEAESCTLSQAVVATNHTGFSGTGFVDYNNVVGSFVECTVSAAAAGNATRDVALRQWHDQQPADVDQRERDGGERQPGVQSDQQLGHLGHADAQRDAQRRQQHHPRHGDHRGRRAEPGPDHDPVTMLAVSTWLMFRTSADEHP